MQFERSKKYYFKGDGSDTDSSNGMLVESFLCNFTTPAPFHYFRSEIQTILGCSFHIVTNDSLCKYFSFNPQEGFGSFKDPILGHKLYVKGLNEDIESPTDVPTKSENIGTSGSVVLRVLLFGLIN